MIPDLDLQLQVVIKALKDTVMPAVDPAHRMAIEQLGLSIATLSMVRERLPLAGLREWQDLANAIALGRATVAEVSSAVLEQAIGDGAALLDEARPAPGARTAATRAVLSAVSMAVREADDGSETALMRTIVEASRPALDLARAWSKSAGFEPDPDEVPEVVALLTGTVGVQRTGVR
ncbi:hypothetical protein [Sphingosinicella soli]|uniref:Uncharacterized protein n=1 Tax=Sphingosinicella soli TaxID=333708 RepID=A0A7W7B073_9SPHN|nr:hypothetical protein [Sphingosinicella soli]MBB4631630.1 hypothetical protein [Sphingosinicella soli]